MSSSGSSRQYDPSAYQYLLKIVLAGSSGAGKTSLLLRYVDDCFSINFISTIGVDFKIKTEQICGCQTKLQMWDTAGQDRFKSVASNFYRCADAVIIVFDVCNPHSLTEAESWVGEARRYGPPDCRTLLVGNKVDSADGGDVGTGHGGALLHRQVDHDTAKAFADRLGMTYIETSAKTGHNVQKAFTSLAQELVLKKREENGGQDPIPGDTYRSNNTRGVVLDPISRRPVTSDQGGSCFQSYICSTV